MSEQTEQNVCTIERRGEALILDVSPAVEQLRWDLIEHAANYLLEPIRQEEHPLVVVDLENIKYFGSVFLSILLRCWKHVSAAGGMMVICSADKQARELLKVTALDSLWAIYDSRSEALAALDTD